MVKKGKASGLGVLLRKGTKKQQKTSSKKKAAKFIVPGSFMVLSQSLVLIRSNWRVLGGILLVYALVNIIFTGGLSVIMDTFAAVKDNLLDGRSFSNALSGLNSLLSNSQSGSQLQGILLVLESLVVIWALRQLLANKKFSIKEAYYKSMFPLIPFLLIFIVIILQLLPVTLGSGALALISETIASSAAVALIVAIVLLPLLGWSLYMLSSSIFALYIVTLPDMHPRQALRSAKKLVQYRRLKVIRRLLFLPLVIFIGLAAVMVPLILYANVLVVPVFYILSVFLILFVHAYLYNLYMGLLE